MRIGVDMRALEGAPKGGVAQYIRNLTPALVRSAPSHEFLLFTNSYRADCGWLDAYRAPNVLLRPFSYPNKLLFASTRLLSRPRIDQLLGGVDVFFSPHTLPAPLSPGVGRVAVFHDLSFERFPEFFDRRRRLWHRGVGVRAQARTADALIAVSRSTKVDLQERYGIEEQRIRVIYPGLPTIAAPSPSARTLLGSMGVHAPYILSVCTVEPRKNLVTLVRAFERFRRSGGGAYTLVLAGPKGWLWEETLAEVEKSSFREDIVVLGEVASEVMGQLYADAALFVYPSFYEGFGFPPLEAMAHGVPLIASMTSSVPEVVGEAALLVDPNRVDMLASLIAEVLSDKDLAAELSAAGRRRAQQFSWEKTAEETIAVLQEVGRTVHTGEQ